MNSSRVFKEIKKKEKPEKAHPHPEYFSSGPKTSSETELVAKSLRKWEEAKFDKNIQQRSYHSAVIYNSNLYIFGGYEINRGIMDDFYSLDLENKDFFSWTLLNKNTPKSIYPEPMHRHSAIVYKEKMFIYGGRISIFENSNKLYSYDFETNEWELMDENPSQTTDQFQFPLYLDSHNAEIYGKEMLVFGGFIGGAIAQYSRSVIAFDLESHQWSSYYLQTIKEKIKKVVDLEKKKNISEKRIYPRKRANAGTSIYRDTLFIFGGTNGKKKLNDMWKFDLLVRNWTEIIITDFTVFPDARSGHVMLNYQDKIILFGGIHDIAHEKNDILVFNCSEQSWVRIEEDSTKRPDQPSNSSRQNIFRKKTTMHENSQIFGESKPKFGLIMKELKGPTNNSFFKSNVYSKSSKAVKPNATRRSILFNTTVTTPAPKSPRELKEERVRKEQNMKKIMLLSEFDVSDEIQRKLVIHSPTTEAMRNSINTIKIENKADFRNTVEKMKLKDTQAHALMLINNSLNPNEKRVNLIKGKKPCARDGCSANLYKEKLVIFGGDRHLMTFHDMFFLNLKIGFEDLE